jgi:hypothetical protein
MMRRVVPILLAVVVLAGLVLFCGPLVRGLTLGALVAGLIVYGPARPYFGSRMPRLTVGDARAPERGVDVMRDGNGWAYDGRHGFRNQQTWLVAGWLNSEPSFRDAAFGMARQESDAHQLGIRIRAYVGEHFEPELVDDLSVVDWDAIGAAWLKKADEARRTRS